MFRPDMREQIIERMATMSPTSVEVVENVARELESKFGANRSRTFNQTGGVRMAAQVINSLPPNMSKTILTALSERNAELGEAIRKKMFTFEELEGMDTRMLQTILQSVDLSLLVMALKTSSEKLKNIMLSCLSKRAAQIVLPENCLFGACSTERD